MLRQKSKIDDDGYEFEQLGQSSPELKPQENQDEEQISSTERSDNIDKNSPNSIQSNQTIQRESNLIKIMPVLQLNADEDSNFNKQKQQSSKQQKNRKKRAMRLSNINRLQADSSEGQSPIFFNLQVEEDQSKPQTIGFSPPQSSRRRLNPKRRQRKKKFQQPPKIIQKTQKTESTFRQEQIKKSKRLQQTKQKQKQKLTTQIFKYEEQSNQSQSYGTDSQQVDSQEEKDKVDEIQYTFQRKIKVDKQKQKQSQNKKQIFFKSNSFFTLINAEIPKGKHINCILRKKREGIFSMTTKYELFLYDDKKYLMTAIKTSYKLTSHFQFFKDKEITQSGKKNKQCLYGILDSNFSGTQYVLKTVIQYDTISERSTAIDRKQMTLQESQTVISDQCSQQKIKFPQENSKQKQKIEDLQIKEVCYINFKASLMGLGGQRDVKILKKNNKKIVRSGKFSDLKNAFDNGQFEKLKEITTRKAQKGAEGYQLDFKGFAKVNSDKNIILQNSKGIQNLIFGKAKEDIYFLSISHPFSILQGFAFGVSNLDGKVFVN